MKKYSPKCAVVFKTTEDNFICDASADLMSLSTNKAYGRPAGTWQMMLSYKADGTGKRYNEKLEPDNLVTIEMTGDDGKLLPVMLGLVDRVSVVFDVDAQGCPIRLVKVSGQDLGKIFLIHDIGWDIIEAKIKLYKQNSEKNGNEIQELDEWKSLNRLFPLDKQIGTPAQLVTNLLDFTFYNLLELSDRVEKVINTDDTWHTNDAQFATLQGHSLWKGLCQVANLPYNQLHADTSPDNVNFFKLYLEKLPFKDEEKARLSRFSLHELAAEDIIASDLGRADHERVNFLFLNCAIYQIALDMTVDIQMVAPDLHWKDNESIKKHGLRLQKVTCLLYPPTVQHRLQTAKTEEFSAIRKRRDTFVNWYKYNHEYESGSLQIHLRPDIRAGQGLKIKQPNGKYKECLVEQVAHQLNWGIRPKFITTLHVTRGQNHDA